LVEFTDDLIPVDERCGGVGGLVHTSKFAVFVVLKIFVCIGSDCFENVFSVRLVGLGSRRGPGDVDVCPNSNSGVWAVVACCGIGRE
jgi:hypothetical protein